MDSVPTQAPPLADVGRGSVAPGGRLSVRLATAALGIPITVALVVLGLPWLFWGVAVVIVVAIAEFYRMLERIGYQPIWEAGVGAGVLFAIQAAWPQPWYEAVLPAAIVYTVIVQLRRGRLARAVANTALTLFGAVYVGYLMSYILRLRAFGNAPGEIPGQAAALLVVFSVWAADSAAYFVGVGAGRRKLFPGVSPNKSVEGAAGGVVAGVIAALVSGAAFHIGLPMAAVVGGLCAVASILGDLWESAIKREAGVKDAGGVLPGHGGMLDRFDGLLFAMAVGYYVMLWWPGAR